MSHRATGCINYKHTHLQTLSFVKREELVAFTVVVNTYYQLLVDANAIIMEGNLKPPERWFKVGENGGSVSPPISLSVCLSVCLSAYQFVSLLYIHQSVSFICLFIFNFLSVCLSILSGYCAVCFSSPSSSLCFSSLCTLLFVFLFTVHSLLCVSLHCAPSSLCFSSLCTLFFVFLFTVHSLLCVSLHCALSSLSALSCGSCLHEANHQSSLVSAVVWRSATLLCGGQPHSCVGVNPVPVFH